MKRHPALITLSRDHHHALSLGNRIRQQPDADHSAAIAAQRDELLQHFAEEEQQFAPLWPRLQRLDLQQRFNADHAALRQLLQPPFQAALLADTLMAHVRFEERELFAALQDLLPTS